MSSSTIASCCNVKVSLLTQNPDHVVSCLLADALIKRVEDLENTVKVIVGQIDAPDKGAEIDISIANDDDGDEKKERESSV